MLCLQCSQNLAKVHLLSLFLFEQSHPTKLTTSCHSLPCLYFLNHLSYIHAITIHCVLHLQQEFLWFTQCVLSVLTYYFKRIEFQLIHMVLVLRCLFYSNACSVYFYPQYMSRFISDISDPQPSSPLSTVFSYSAIFPSGMFHFPLSPWSCFFLEILQIPILFEMTVCLVCLFRHSQYFFACQVFPWFLHAVFLSVQFQSCFPFCCQFTSFF